RATPEPVPSVHCVRIRGKGGRSATAPRGREGAGSTYHPVRPKERHVTATLPNRIAGIEIPDTPLVRATTEFIRDAEDDLLFHHSRRVYLFGALQGRRRGLNADLELLYVGAMFHDLGLTEPYRSTSTLRFEVDGANAA